MELTESQLEDWREERRERMLARRVRRVTSRLGLASLPLLVVATATGLWLYTEALREDRPSPALVWIHVAASTIGLAVVTVKLVEHGRVRLARRLAEGVSLVLAALALPLLVTGALLLLTPSNGSRSAYLHLIAASWWMALLGLHLLRYLSRSLDAALRGRASDDQARAPFESR